MIFELISSNDVPLLYVQRSPIAREDKGRGLLLF